MCNASRTINRSPTLTLRVSIVRSSIAPKNVDVFLNNQFRTVRRLQVPSTLIVPPNWTPRIATVDLFGSRFICCSTENAARLIVKELAHSKQLPFLITHINTHNFRTISSNHRLLEALKMRAWCFLEGIGLKTACVLTNGWSPDDTNGTDLFPALLMELKNIPCRLFLLGSHSTVVTMAARKIKERWKHIDIVGYRDGYFSNDEIPHIRDEIRRAKPTLLLIGLGSPRQEEVALEFLQLPDLQVVWTVGGLFDFLSGRIKRAPAVVRMLRLEWLFRICHEPRRLAFRYFFDAFWLTKSCAHQCFARFRSLSCLTSQRVNLADKSLTVEAPIMQASGWHYDGLEICGYERHSDFERLAWRPLPILASKALSRLPRYVAETLADVIQNKVLEAHAAQTTSATSSPCRKGRLVHCWVPARDTRASKGPEFHFIGGLTAGTLQILRGVESRRTNYKRTYSYFADTSSIATAVRCHPKVHWYARSQAGCAVPRFLHDASGFH